MHPAEHDELGLVLACRGAGQTEGVAAGVGPPHHVVALVVVAEDEDPGAEGSPGGADHPGQRVVGRGAVALGEGLLEPEHRVCPLQGRASIWPAGTAWSPIRGYVGLDARFSAGYQAGTSQFIADRPGPRSPVPSTGCARRDRGPAGHRSRMKPPPPRHSGIDAISAPHRVHSRRPGLVPVLRRRGPRAVRGQGQVAAAPPSQLLAGFGQAGAADGTDGGPGRPRRVGGRRQRGGRARSSSTR